MTSQNIEEVFSPRYLEDATSEREYFENVERPEMEMRAVVEWESYQSNAN